MINAWWDQVGFLVLFKHFFKAFHSFIFIIHSFVHSAYNLFIHIAKTGCPVWPCEIYLFSFLLFQNQRGRSHHRLIDYYIYTPPLLSINWCTLQRGQASGILPSNNLDLSILRQLTAGPLSLFQRRNQALLQQPARNNVYVCECVSMCVCTLYSHIHSA